MTPLRLTLLLGFALVGCAPAPQPATTMPPREFAGAGDPTRIVIIETAWAFGGMHRLAGQPAAAAEAVAQLTWLADEIPTGARWRHFNPLVGTQLRQGRAEAWAALGIPPEAPPQAVIDGLSAARTALRAGDMRGAEAALAPAVFPAGGPVVIARLGALPAMPSATAGTRNAMSEMDRDEAVPDGP